MTNSDYVCKPKYKMDVLNGKFITKWETRIIIERGVVAINPKYDKLITALRTAVEYDGSLDKEATSYPDIIDPFRLSLKAFRFGGPRKQMQKPRICKV